MLEGVRERKAENYYYRCENVEGNSESGKAGGSYVNGVAPTIGGVGQILWLLHWYYYVVPSFGVKSFSPSWVEDFGIIIKQIN